MGRKTSIQFLAEAGIFSLHHCVQINYGAHPASYQMGIRGPFPKDTVTRAWRLLFTSIKCWG